MFVFTFIGEIEQSMMNDYDVSAMLALLMRVANSLESIDENTSNIANSLEELAEQKEIVDGSNNAKQSNGN